MVYNYMSPLHIVSSARQIAERSRKDLCVRLIVANKTILALSCGTGTGTFD